MNNSKMFSSNWPGESRSLCLLFSRFCINIVFVFVLVYAPCPQTEKESKENEDDQLAYQQIELKNPIVEYKVVIELCGLESGPHHKMNSDSDYV